MEELTTWKKSVSKSDKLLQKGGQAVIPTLLNSRTHQETLLFSCFRSNNQMRVYTSSVCKAMCWESYGPRGGVRVFPNVTIHFITVGHIFIRHSCKCHPGNSRCRQQIELFKAHRHVQATFRSQFWLFFFLALSCISSLYILEIKPLSVMSLAKMFSHTVGSVFILLMVSLAVQKLFNLMCSPLFVFALFLVPEEI